MNHQRLEVQGRIPIHGDDGETALPCRSPQALWRYARYYAYGPMAYGLWPMAYGRSEEERDSGQLNDYSVIV